MSECFVGDEFFGKITEVRILASLAVANRNEAVNKM